MPSDRTILVTGAGGFIGGRMVEVMHSLGAGEVRGAVRRWASGARIGRLSAPIVKCDIRDAAAVDEALKGVTHIVHCAVGDRSSTVDGTRTLLEGAARAGVQRIVHLSTVDVYGTATGSVDETRPLERTGKEYGDTKIEAEEVCQTFASQGLPIVIFRPTLVHGPFSATWTIAYAQRLQRRPWLIPEADAQGVCNLLYVDDLVGATLAAFDADVEPGSAFNINGPERPTWHDYFVGLNQAMGLPPLQAASAAGARATAAATLPFRNSAKFLIKHFQKPIMGVAARSDAARDIMMKAERLLRTTPVPGEFAVYGKDTVFESTKMEEGLGYVPRFPMSDALPLTASWLRHHGFIES